MILFIYPYQEVLIIVVPGGVEIYSNQPDTNINILNVCLDQSSTSSDMSFINFD